MIVNERKNDIATENIGKTTKFQMKVCGAGFRIISDGIYTRKAEAVVREISCNAWDAHLEVDNPEPFDIHLPTRLEPWFACRDYGPGLSDDDVRMVFCTYFESTKTDSNKFTGAKGLGSKSPYCLDDVSSYTVISFYEGKKTTYAMYLDEVDEPVITDLSCEDSDEPNGLEIHVPVSTDYIKSFEEAAIRVYPWFSTQPNINVPSVVNAIEVEQKSLNGKFSDSDQFSIDIGYGDLYIVMGNVAYRDDNYYSYDHPLHNVEGWVRVPMGSIEVDAGRENITDTKSNREVIRNRVEDITDYLKKEIPSRIKEKKSVWERNVLALKYRRISNQFNISLKDYIKKVDTNGIKIYMKQGGHRTTTTNPYNVYQFCHLDLYIARKGYDKRIRYNVRENDKKLATMDVKKAIRLNIPPHLLNEPSDLPPIPKKQRQSTGGTTSSGPRVRKTTLSVVKYVGDRWSEKDKWSDAEVPIEYETRRVYVNLERWEPDVQHKIIELAFKLFDVPIYGIRKATSNLKSWQSGNWVHITEWATTAVKNYEFSEYVVDYVNHDTKRMIEYLVGCKDPDFQTIHDKLEDAGESQPYKDLCKLLNVEPTNDFHDLDKDIEELKEKYPLLRKWNWWDNNDVKSAFITYINAIYSCGENE